MNDCKREATPSFNVLYAHATLKAMPQDRIIYHYRPFCVFRNIIEKSELWLTATADMADSSEHECINSAISRWKSNYPADVNNINIKNCLDDYELNYKKNSFLCCFSANGDLENQWQDYGNTGMGVAIGFSMNKLEIQHYFPRLSINPKNTIGLLPVIYSQEMQYKITETLLNDIVCGKRNFDNGLLHLCAMALICKKPEYSKEMEFRIVYTPFDSEPKPLIGILGKEERLTPKGPSPYYRYRLPQGISSIESVILGPKCKSSIQEIKEMLQYYGNVDAMVTKSET